MYREYRIYPNNINGTTPSGLMYGSPLHHAPTSEEGADVVNKCTRVLMLENLWLSRSSMDSIKGEGIEPTLVGEHAPSLQDEMRICRVSNYVWMMDNGLI